MWVTLPNNKVDHSEPVTRQHLIIRSDPLNVENIRNWLHRLSGLNGLTGVPSLLWAAGLGRGASLFGREDLVERLATITGVEARLIEERLPRVAADRRNFCGGVPGHQLSFKLLRSKLLQVCPLCIRERYVAPAVWDIRFWIACPIHGCRMAQACGSCGEPLRWDRPGIRSCSSPKCPSLVDSLHPELAPNEVVEMARWFAEAAHSPSGFQSDLAKAFPGVRLAEALHLVALFCRTQIVQSCSEAESSLYSEQSITATALALSDWPSGFHRYLDRIRDAEIGENTLGLHSEFPFFTELRQAQGRSSSNLLSVTGPILETEFRKYLDQSRHQDPIKVHRRLRRSGDTGTSTWVSADKAAKLLNMHNEAVRSLIGQGVLKGQVRRGGSLNYGFVERASLEEFLSSSNRKLKCREFKVQSEALSPSEVMSRLGISWLLVKQLECAGILKTILRPPRVYFASDSVDGLLALFAQSVSPSRAIELRMCLPWLMRGRSYLEISELVSAVKNGSLVPCDIDRSQIGLARYRFCKNALMAFLREGESNQIVSLKEAQERLRCGWGDIPRFLSASLLHRSGRGISKESLERFDQIYVCLNVLADSCGIQATALARMLRERGCQPVFLNEGVGRRMVWKRSGISDHMDAILACRRNRRI